MKYLVPRADLTFNRVFGEHPDLVMSLSNYHIDTFSPDKPS